MVIAWTLAPAVLLALVVGSRHPRCSWRASNLSARAARGGTLRHVGPDVELRAPIAGRGAGCARARAPGRRGTAARELSAPARRESRLRAGTRAYGPGQSARHAVPDNPSLRWYAARALARVRALPVLTRRSAAFSPWLGQQQRACRKVCREAGESVVSPESALSRQVSRSAEGAAQGRTLFYRGDTADAPGVVIIDGLRRASGPTPMRSAAACTSPTRRTMWCGPDPG